MYSPSVFMREDTSLAESLYRPYKIAVSRLAICLAQTEQVKLSAHPAICNQLVSLFLRHMLYSVLAQLGVSCFAEPQLPIS